jgi:hypothetical protein
VTVTGPAAIAGAAIEAAGLERRFGEVAALAGVDLAVASGEWLAVTGKPQPGETKRNWDIWKAGQAGHQIRFSHCDIGFLSPNNGNGNNRCLGFQRHLHKAASAETSQLVAVFVQLANPFVAFRENADQLFLLQQPGSIFNRSHRLAHLHKHRRQERQRREPVGVQIADQALGGMFIQNGHHHHRTVPGQLPRMVADQQSSFIIGDMLDAGCLHPPVEII